MGTVIQDKADLSSASKTTASARPIGPAPTTALVQVQRRLPAIPDKALPSARAEGPAEAYHVTARWGNFVFFSAWIAAADPDEAMAIAVARINTASVPASPGVALWIAAAVLAFVVLAALAVLPA